MRQHVLTKHLPSEARGIRCDCVCAHHCTAPCSPARSTFPWHVLACMHIAHGGSQSVVQVGAERKKAGRQGSAGGFYHTKGGSLAAGKALRQLPPVSMVVVDEGHTGTPPVGPCSECPHNIKRPHSATPPAQSWLRLPAGVGGVGGLERREGGGGKRRIQGEDGEGIWQSRLQSHSHGPHRGGAHTR